MDQNFVDLRQNQGHSGLDHSFWPSFTDIMMVVVMIFIIASTVLIVRNWELVSELRATLEAERQAQAKVTVFQATSRSLEEQLAQIQQALSESRIRNLQLVELSQEQREQIARYLEQLLALRTEQAQLSGQWESARRQAALLAEQLAQIQARYAQLEQEHEQRASRLEEVLAALALLEQRQQQSLAELGTLRQERAKEAQSLATLRTDYQSLDEKYQKLIQPARSVAGKQVVEVLYRRNGGAPQIQLRAPREKGFKVYSASTMHQRLTALKAQHGKDLYVKIIIPKDSDLTYNEAWDFTRKLLERYDYYYQP